MRGNDVELLAPARDLATGREAILHGADAVYIGAPKFGARAAAGNSVEDIAELVRFAHAYHVKVYVTLNTILYDAELDEACRLAWQLYRVGVDALIVQDLRFVRDLPLPPLPLHASTQMDNQTAEKVGWLHGLGFQQAVLARELTLDEIRDIHRRVPDIRLEVFVHGAICVCYNGRCFASEHCFARSANRGECAQFCRLPFDLVEVKGEGRRVKGEGSVLMKQRHLLSLRDMNRSHDLEALLDAGARSLKIEGRLKDVSYVKNVVAYYRQRLDEIFRRRPGEYRRSSLGHEAIAFTPNPAKSFNRLFTDYFLHGRTPNMANIHTPKSMGERMDCSQFFTSFKHKCTVHSSQLHNGDGLCYINDEGELVGFRVNRVEGDKVYLANGKTILLSPTSPLPSLPRGGTGVGDAPLRHKGLYRNFDHDFEQQLAKPTATRKIGVRWLLKEQPSGFLLRLTREDGATTEQTFAHPHEPARSPQTEPVSRQLSRLGDTPYETTGIDFEMSDNWFIPGSILADWRRSLTERLSCIANDDTGHEGTTIDKTKITDDTINRQRHPDEPGLLMTCRYCIRHELGMCLKNKGVKAKALYLRLADGRCFRLHFDCKRCQMEVYAD